jgi:O-antigen/teichoic acid export membrane protein
MVAFAVALGLFAREILFVLATPQFLTAYPYVGTLALGLVIHGAYSIVGIGVQLAQRTKYLAWTSGLAAVVNIGLNIVLIPRIGIAGAALATVAAYALSTGLLYGLAQRAYVIPYRLLPNLTLLIGSAIVLAGGLWLDSLAPGSEWSLPVTLAKALILVMAVGSVAAVMHITPWQLLSQVIRATRQG